MNREQISITRTRTGVVVTVTLTNDDPLPGSATVKWSVRTFAGSIPEGIEQARAGARKALAAIAEVAEIAA